MKKVAILPNLITTGNLACGFAAICFGATAQVLLSTDGAAAAAAKLETAAWLILLGMVFDALDGKVARMMKATSRFGMEFDSLADLVSFGVAPALLVYQWSLSSFGRFGWLAAFLFVACGALRLEITCTPGTVHLWWEDSAAPQFWRVETAPTTRGPWQTLGETTNPHWSQPITTRNAFFRIRGVSVQGGNR